MLGSRGIELGPAFLTAGWRGEERGCVRRCGKSQQEARDMVVEIRELGHGLRSRRHRFISCSLPNLSVTSSIINIPLRDNQ